MSCLLPSPLVLAYVFAVAVSGRAKNILMAGFDGYPMGDLRNKEMEKYVGLFQTSKYRFIHNVSYPTYEGLDS